ncbi:MAG: hypothetical protein ABI615_03770 [Chthoniobacterales bacterium]
MKRKGITTLAGALVLLTLFANTHVFGRTISLRANDMDMMAAIVEEGPRHSWVSYTAEGANGIYRVNPILISLTHSFLFRFSLEKIPKGQRITNAELSIKLGATSKGARIFIWRIVADWGPGVNHIYRMQRPKAVAWALPGARANSSDRATKPSAMLSTTEAGEQVINLTEDVELWYSGAAHNYGWQISSEDTDAYFLLSIPVTEIQDNWELRVTYEPQ